MKTKSAFRWAVLIGIGLFLRSAAALAQPALVSVANPGEYSVSAGGDSLSPIVSRDGRYVLFSSSVDNLIANADGMPFAPIYPAALNVYLYDRTNRTMTLVSADNSGRGGGNGDSIATAISTNGQFVLFESAATNLLPGDTNGLNDVFVRDVVNGVTSLISVGTNGSVGNGESHGSTMTPDGRYVAFVSASSNLVQGDTNNLPDVFVRDLIASNTVLVSVGAMYTNTSVPTNSSESPDISDNGQYVAFYSTATNLLPGVATIPEIYVRDIVNGFTVQASTNALSLVQTAYNATNVISGDFTMSADGQYVAYVAGAGNVGSAFQNGVLVRYHVLTGAMDIINTNAQGNNVGAEGTACSLAMTPNGSFIVFVTNSYAQKTNLQPDALWIWNAQANTTALINSSTTTGAYSYPDYFWPQISDDGRYVVFFSGASNLSSNPAVTGFQLYAYDSLGTNITLVDPRIDGSAPLYLSPSPVSISSNGQIIAFDSFDPALVTKDVNRSYDVFIRDLNTNTVQLISAALPALQSLAPNGQSALSPFSVSTNARYIAFTSDATNLVANDTNLYRDVFVRDLLTGSNILVSVATNGAFANGPSTDCAITGDGRYVAFTSSASNLVTGDTNNSRDVFVRDLQAGTTTLVSVNTNGNGSGNADSISPMISSDGRYVLFQSKSSNLAPGFVSTNTLNLFWRDLQAGTTVALSTNGLGAGTAMTSNGRYVAFSIVASPSVTVVWDMLAQEPIYMTSGSPGQVALSPDGAHFAYATTQVYFVDITSNNSVLLSGCPTSTHSGLQFSADARYLVFCAGGMGLTNQIVLYDSQIGQTNLISKAYNLVVGANGPSDSPTISADGRFIAYRSAASNSVPGNPTGIPGVILYDRNSGDTILLNCSLYGNVSGNNRSLTPVFSGDSRTIAFTTWASDVAPQTFNQSGNVVAFSLYTSNTAPALNVTVTPPATISWPAVAGKSYQVQFKNDLSDPLWQVVNGNVSVVGSQGYTVDLAPAPTQRFYRVMAY